MEVVGLYFNASASQRAVLGRMYVVLFSRALRLLTWNMFKHSNVRSIRTSMSPLGLTVQMLFHKFLA